jgi:hypothetical protein
MSTIGLGIRLSAQGGAQAQAEVTKLGQAVEQFGAAARGATPAGAAMSAQHQAMAGSARLNANQTAQLSAQLQDLFVQIQAGGSPLTAFIQQGSQLSAVFGGFGPALKAVGSLITPSVAAMGAAAAGGAAVALAYKQGAEEGDAFARAVILSGNASGTTTSRMKAMAAAQDEVTGTHAQAAAVIADLADSGKVAEAQIAALTDAAVRMDAAGGPAVDSLVKKFEALGESPLRALVKLNEAENFLTRAVYDQVRALEQQGNTAEAAAVAQEAYAQAVKTRAAELEGRLGSLERAWLGVKRVAAEAWDAMAGIGREQTIQEKLSAAQKELAAKETRGPTNDRPEVIASHEKGLRVLRATVETLRAQVYAENEAATAQQASAESVKQYVAAQDEAERRRKQGIDDARKLAQAGRELAMSLQLEAAGLSGDFLDKWGSLNAAYAAGALSVAQLDAAHRRLLDSQPAVSAMAKAEEDARARAAAALGDQVKAREAEFAGLMASGRALADQVAQQQAGNLTARTGIDYSGQLAVAKLREAAVTAELAAIKAEEKNLDFALGEQYRKNAAELRSLADAKAAAMAGAVSSAAQKSIEDFLDPSKAETFGDALRGAFDGAASSLAKLSEVMGDYSRKQAAIAAERAKLDKVTDPAKRQQLEMKLNERAADQQIQNYAQIAGAAKGFFAEGSKGYRTLQAAEQAFQAYQLASDLVKGASAAAVAVANQAQGDPYTAWARMALMAGAMGTLGFAVAGGFNRGSAAPSAADRQEANGTGTVLGDAKAKSESIARSLEVLEDSARIELETQSGMLRALRNIEASLAGLGNLVVRSNGITTGKNFGIKTGALSVNEGDPLAKALGLGGFDKLVGSINPVFGAIGDALHGLWGKVKQDVTDAGLSIGGSVSDLAGGRGVQQYADVTQTASSWFGLKKKTNTSTLFGDVSGDLAAQFGMVFENIGDVLKGAAGELGRDGEAVAQQVAQFVVDIPRLSLKGLNGEEVQEAIGNAISATADKAAQAVVGGLEDFQKIGEGYFETVVRVAAGVEEAAYELEQLGIAAVSFGSIANKQGDIAAEIVRQSIVAAETAGGALSNVGQIISNFDGDAAELADTFESLIDVRDALQLVGMSGDALTVALIRAAGGLDELSSLLDGYHENFYTAEERRAATLAEVSAGLAALGEVLPETRDGFRAIVERIGTKGDAGALAAVLRLADAFASVTPSADELARAASDAAKDAAAAAEKADKDRKKAAEDAARDAADAAEKGAAAQRRARKAFDDIAADMARGVADAFDAVRTQIEAEQDRISDETQKQVDALDKRADDVRSVFGKIADAMGGLRESLQQTIDEISGELAGDEGRAAAREKLSAMLATARAGGKLDPEAVKRAAGIASNLTTDPFGTKADYLRDAARLQGTLRDLSAEAGNQAAAAEAAMNAELKGIAEEVAGVKEKAEAQLKVLRQQLDEARTAASALASIDEGVHSVSGAIQALAGAIAATKAITGQDGAGPSGQWLQSGGSEVYRDAAGAVGVRKVGDSDPAGLSIRGKVTSFTAQEAADWIEAQVGAGQALSVYNRARAEGLSLSSVDALMAGKGWKPGTSAAWAAANSLPAFADGGRHAGGARLVGERGPEIEVTGPSRIHTFDQLMTMAGGGRRDESLVAEVRKLRAELERMHSNTSAQQLAIAEHTSKTAAIVRRWEGDGMPAERT